MGGGGGGRGGAGESGSNSRPGDGAGKRPPPRVVVDLGGFRFRATGEEFSELLPGDRLPFRTVELRVDEVARSGEGGPTLVVRVDPVEMEDD